MIMTCVMMISIVNMLPLIMTTSGEADMSTNRQEQNEIFQQTQFLDGANAVYIEQLYAQYQDNPASVSADWQEYFSNRES